MNQTSHATLLSITSARGSANRISRGLVLIASGIMLPHAWMGTWVRHIMCVVGLVLAGTMPPSLLVGVLQLAGTLHLPVCYGFNALRRGKLE